MGVVFTKKCVLCGANLSSLEDGKSAMLCDTCAAEVREKYRFSGHIRISGADGASAALYYTGTVKGAMQRFKFEHKKHYADWFAAQRTGLQHRPLLCWLLIWMIGSPISSPLLRSAHCICISAAIIRLN